MKTRPGFSSVVALLVMLTLGGCQGTPISSVKPTLSSAPAATPVPTASTASTAPARTVSSPSADDWAAYANGRYGYAVYYPAGWTAGDEAENGDGRVLTADGGVSLTVYGTNSTASIAQVHKDALASAEADGVVVTYQTSTSNRSVVSGIKGSTVYYSSAWCGKGSCNYLTFAYPTAAKATMDPLVTTITQRFAPGRLDEAN